MHFEELLQQYFCAGWRNGGRSTEDVLSAMISRESPARLMAACAGITDLLDRGLCEPQLLDVVLYEIGCDVAPEREGDASSWLEAIRRRLLMSNSGPPVRRSGEPQPWETP